ncbi:hypothetical protein [Streptomyces sp. NPDC001502]|uniref:hypothetical protein n=1 Tax=Streptomyces sp. NPDC001502 TaxID=3364578 RepID=UPI0036BCEAB0
MSDAMIRVPAEVRDRLAVIAESRGTSIRSLVQEFAETTLTAEERRERAALAQMCRDGVPAGVAAAVHAARHLPEWGSQALVATVEPKAYEGQGVGVFDLNR